MEYRNIIVVNFQLGTSTKNLKYFSLFIFSTFVVPGYWVGKVQIMTRSGTRRFWIRIAERALNH
jgi:hypothetical protein